MNGRNSIKTFAALYCDVIILDSYIRSKDFMGTQFTKSCVSAFVWLGIAVFLHLANGMLMKKERSLSFVAAVNVAMGIPEALLLYRFLTPETIFGHLILMAAMIFVHARVVNRYFEAVTIDSVIRFAELSVCGFIVVIFYRSVSGLGISVPAMMFSAILVSMLAVFFARIEGAGNTEKNSALKAAGVVAGITAAVIASCAAFAVFFSDAAGKGIKGLTEMLLQMLLTIGRSIGAVLEWLISLIPMKETEMELPEPDSVNMPNVAMPVAETSDAFVRAAMIAGILAVIVLVIVLLLVLRKYKAVKLGTVKVQKAGAISRSSLLDSLKRMLREWVKSVRTRIGLFRIRNTAPGILIFIAKRNEKTAYKKDVSESYGAYGRRLASVLCVGEENAEMKKLLCKLAEEFDRQFFDDEAMVVYSGLEAGKIRSELTKLVRQ